MSPDELRALALRAEQATGPDRELDERIGMAIGMKRTIRVGHECLGNDREVPVMCPHYTSSIDAAMTLVPEGMRDEIEITTLHQVARVSINLNHAPDDGPHYGSNECNSIPLALCAAALHARASTSGES